MKPFRRYHLVTDEGHHNTRPRIVSSPRPYMRAAQASIASTLRALAGTKNNSSPGPDRIPHRLLNLIRETPLRQALINDIGLGSEVQVAIQESQREMAVVMNPKSGKDRHKVKDWRPKVLASTVGKIGEKVTAVWLQRVLTPFWGMQYGSRKGRAGIEAMILVSHIERRKRAGDRANLVGKDIVSAFKNIRRDKLVTTLMANRLLKEAGPCEAFLKPTSFQSFRNSLPRGEVRMANGAHQRSPLWPLK